MRGSAPNSKLLERGAWREAMALFLDSDTVRELLGVLSEMGVDFSRDILASGLGARWAQTRFGDEGVGSVYFQAPSLRALVGVRWAPISRAEIGKPKLWALPDYRFDCRQAPACTGCGHSRLEDEGCDCDCFDCVDGECHCWDEVDACPRCNHGYDWCAAHGRVHRTVEVLGTPLGGVLEQGPARWVNELLADVRNW